MRIVQRVVRLGIFRCGRPRRTAGGETAFDGYEFHADNMGSVLFMNDEAGRTVKEYAYDSFGRIVREKGVFPNDRTFTGREFDAETGLYHYRARAYDPETGRFLQRDPRWAANPYAYAANNPATLADPFGEEEECGEKTLYNWRGAYPDVPCESEGCPGSVCGIAIPLWSLTEPCTLNCPRETLEAGDCFWKMQNPPWDLCFITFEKNCHRCVNLPVEIPYKPAKVCCDTAACDECFDDCMTDTENFWGYADLLDGLICMGSCLGVGNGNSIPPPGLGPDKGGPSGDSCGCGCAEEGHTPCGEQKPEGDDDEELCGMEEFGLAPCNDEGFHGPPELDPGQQPPFSPPDDYTPPPDDRGDGCYRNCVSRTAAPVYCEKLCTGYSPDNPPAGWPINDPFDPYSRNDCEAKRIECKPYMYSLCGWGSAEPTICAEAQAQRCAYCLEKCPD